MLGKQVCGHFLIGLRSRKFLILMAFLFLAVAILVCLFIVLSRMNDPERQAKGHESPCAAKVTSVSGLVLIQRPGQFTYRPLGKGDCLSDGDLIHTDKGAASIRYARGIMVYIPARTTFRVLSANENRIEILAPQAAGPTPAGGGENIYDLPRTSAGMLNPAEKTEDRESGPGLQLLRIVPFGRSLEVDGYADPGSSLTINDVPVEIEGDGSFKHFTLPFPAFSSKVNIVLRAKDLAGRSHVMTVTYVFDPHDAG